MARHAQRSRFAEWAFLSLLMWLVAANAAGAHQGASLDFDSLTPGSVFVSTSHDGFVVSSPVPGAVQVHPGAPGCASPVSCADNGTPSLFVAAGGEIRIERSDGGPFVLRQVQSTSVVPIGCDFTAWLYDDPTPVSGSFGCSGVPFAVAGFSPSLEGARIVALELTKPESHFQIDNVIAEAVGSPAEVTLLHDERAIWAAGSNVEFDEYSNIVGCTQAVTQEHSPSVPFMDYDAVVSESHGRAEQESTVSHERMAGSGLARGDSFYCWGFGTSTYVVEFRVHADALAHFEGALQNGTGTTTASLTHDGASIFFFEGSGNPTSLHEEAVLEPGDYRLEVVADTNGWIGGWEATYDVELLLSSVPSVPIASPAARIMLMAVLAGLAAGRLRRSRSPNDARSGRSFADS